MIKPAVVRPTDEVTVISEVFGTPLVAKGATWLPVVELITWPIMAWVAKRRLPARTWLQSFDVGALTTTVVLGSEWCHNLAHAAAAQGVGKPMDAIRVTWGMPLVVYYDVNDETVTPRQHIVRALGGPVFNLLVLPLAFLLRRRSQPDSVIRDISLAAVGANALLPAVGLLPIPFFDGGPILKWSLVGKGHSLEAAEMTVRKVDGVLGFFLALAGILSFRKRRWLVGGILTQLAVVALGVALGVFKEQE